MGNFAPEYSNPWTLVMNLIDISSVFYDQILGKQRLKTGSSSAYAIFSNNVIIDTPLGYEKGINSLKFITDFWFKAFPDGCSMIEKIEVCGHGVVVQWKACGTHLGTLQGIPPTRKKIVCEGEAFFTFNHKKEIIYYAEKHDMNDLLSQLDVQKPFINKSPQELLCGNLTLLIMALKQTYAKLTDREIECCSLFISGFSAKQIGIMLSISHRTVETHLEKGRLSLGCTNRIQMIEKFLVEQTYFLFQDLARLLTTHYSGNLLA